MTLWSPPITVTNNEARLMVAINRLRDVLREAREDLIDLHADWDIVARIDAALDTADQPTDVFKQE